MPAISRVFILIAGLSLMVVTQLSAYGFHGLEGKVPVESIRAWEWAVEIQSYHSLGLVLIALLLSHAQGSILLRIAGGLMVIGVVLFSGSTYAEILGAPEAIGSVAPLGGAAIMLGWLLTAIAGFRAR